MDRAASHTKCWSRSQELPLGVVVVVAAAARVCGRGSCMLLCRLFLSLFAIIFIWQTQTTSWLFMLIYSTSRDSRVLESVFCCALRLQFLINFPPPARKRVLSQGLPSPPAFLFPCTGLLSVHYNIHGDPFVILIRYNAALSMHATSSRAMRKSRIRGPKGGGTGYTLYRYT